MKNERERICEGCLVLAIGERIKREVLGDKRDVYGKRIVATLSQQLTAE